MAPDSVVLVDETYRESVYGDDPIPASAARMSPRVVTVSSLSKAHGAPGLRVGWLTTADAELHERLREAKFATTIACSTVDELLATQVLRRRAEILAPRAKRLGAALAELETRVAPGSWFGEHDRVFRLDFGHLSTEDFTAALDRLAEALT